MRTNNFGGVFFFAVLALAVLTAPCSSAASKKEAAQVKALYDGKSYERAIALATRALKRAPDAMMLTYRAASYYKRGERQKAIDDCTAAINLNPQIMGPYFCRGTIYAELHQFAKAAEDLTEAIKLDPKNADIYSLRSAVYGNLGKKEESEQDLKKAKELRK